MYFLLHDMLVFLVCFLHTAELSMNVCTSEETSRLYSLRHVPECGCIVYEAVSLNDELSQICMDTVVGILSVFSYSKDVGVRLKWLQDRTEGLHELVLHFDLWLPAGLRLHS